MGDLLCTQTYSSVDLFPDPATRRRARRRTMIESVRDHIQRYRDDGRPFETHNSTTPWSWSDLSYPIPPQVWFLFYREMDRILRFLPEENRTLYIHGAVFVPFNTPLYDRLGMIVYRLFFFNTPYCLWYVIESIRFRLLFVASTAFGDHVRIERLRLGLDPTPTLYPGSQMICET